MQERAFQAIHAAEGSWWYHARIFAVQKILSSFKARNEVICDIGAGYGAMCAALKPYGSVMAFEPEDAARKECEKTCDEVFDSGDLSQLVQIHHGRFSLVTLFDVVEHVEDDVSFLQQVHRLISPHGHILVTVPAYMWLWSELDELAMHYRRYDRKQIVALLEQTGYEIRFVSYWNMMLLVPAYIVRRGTGKAGYSAFSMPKWIDALFFLWVRLESSLMPHIRLLFGTSVFVYARKRQG
jgi:SAM-dependent methyltransferase